MKPMTAEFVLRKSSEFFKGKKATLTEYQENIGGDVINAGEIVTVLRKNLKLKYCFDIRSNTGVNIHCVSCDKLILHK